MSLLDLISTAHSWLTYNLGAPVGCKHNPWGALEDQQGRLWAYDSAKHGRLIGYQELWERQIIPPHGIGNGLWHGAQDILPLNHGQPIDLHAPFDCLVTYHGTPTGDGEALGLSCQIEGHDVIILLNHFKHKFPIAAGMSFKQGSLLGMMYDGWTIAQGGLANCHFHCEVYSMTALSQLASYDNSFKYSDQMGPRTQWLNGMVPKEAGVVNPNLAYIYPLTEIIRSYS